MGSGDSFRSSCPFHFGTSPTTIWGEGISQGHSNALRTIPQVIDGVQFTLPVKN
ncbi:MAG: hypothetical protein IJB95_02695, partial [Clostridia bacterium]|nr:hypothetical protein [Clostridia bacterium]